MNVLALCAGIGGLELGVKLAMPSATVVCYVEREAYPAAVLAERMETLGVAPIWSDLATFDGRPWRGVVDLVTAGYPCQPDSLAGARRGESDERWAWEDVFRVLCEVRPRCAFLENVPGHLSGTFGRVLGDLASLGWRIEWDCVPAAAVGAPHIRDRVFVLAADPCCSRQGRLQPERKRRGCEALWAGENGQDGDAADTADQQSGRKSATRARVSAPRDASESRAAPHASRARLQRSEIWATRPRRSDARGGGATVLPDAKGERLHHGRRIQRSGEGSGTWDIREAPEPGVCGVDDGLPHRVDRLRACGNGVVPQAAERAFTTLWGRMFG